MKTKRIFAAVFGLGAGMLAASILLLALASPARAVMPDPPPRAPDLPLAWTGTAPIPEGRAADLVQCLEEPEGFYLIGGIGPSGTVDTLYHYDAISNTWTLTLTAMPEPRRALAAACYEGKIYVAGGWDIDPEDSFYIYDIAGDSWSSGPALPNVVWGAALGVWDGKLYLVGGTRLDFPWTPVARVDVYDILGGGWTPGGGTSMPTASGFFGAAQRGPYLFAVGGNSGNLLFNVNQTQRYDMSNDSWQVGPVFTSRRVLFALSMTGSRLYAQGGDSTGGGADDATDLVEYLDLSAWPGGTWTNLSDSLPQANLFPAGACTQSQAGGEIWAIGGGLNVSTLYTSTLYRAAEPCLGYTYTLTLDPGARSGGGIPGEVVVYPLTVTNTGDTPDAYSSTVTSVWTTTVSGLEGALDPGLSRPFTVTIEIPVSAAGSDSELATVTLISQGDPTQEDSAALTTGVLAYGVVLSPPAAAQTGLPGATVTYHLLLNNTGNVTDTFALFAGESQWTVTLPMSEMTLAAGAGTEVDVSVAIPTEAVNGAMDSAFILAQSQGDPLVTDGSTLTTTAVIQYGVLLTPPAAAQAGRAGTTLTYPLQLTNTGDYTDTFTLSAGGAQWTVTLPLTETTLAAGVGMDVDVSVAIPTEAVNGAMDSAVILAQSQGNPLVTSGSTLTTTAVIQGVILTPPSAAQTGLAGETVTYTLQLTNTGDITDTYALSAGVAQWTVTLALTETTLGAGEGVEFTGLVAIPAGAAYGAVDQVTITAVSQGNPLVTAHSDLTTTVWWRTYLPVVYKEWQ